MFDAEGPAALFVMIAWMNRHPGAVRHRCPAWWILGLARSGGEG